MACARLRPFRVVPSYGGVGVLSLFCLLFAPVANAQSPVAIVTDDPMTNDMVSVPDPPLGLWAASYQERPAPPYSAAVTVPVEKIANPFVFDALFIGGTGSGDMISTAIALKRCPRCYEANPLGFDQEARISLHIGGMIGVTVLDFALRRTGHKNAARGVAMLFSAGMTALTVNNTIHAVRRR